jgi:microsomal epoxide hydrolase
VSNAASGVTEPAPFKVDVPEAVLDDLRQRLDRTRWPEHLPASGWSRGTDLDYLREVVEHWRRSFDWRRTEAALNAWPQVQVTVDGQNMHAIHARSPEPGALPLLITHGWPGGVLEFLDVLGPLTDPVAHGGHAADAFHVVCPSMPGYGWSGPTSDAGWHIARVAAAEAELMTRLGYERFGAPGGDWGALAACQLGMQVPERLAGIHLNMVVARPPADVDDPTAGLNERELAALADRARIERDEFGYMRIQSTRPETLAFGLTDSPAGLAAWILEKFRAWSDCDGDPRNRFTHDRLLGIVTSYWVTGTIGSSMRLYHETISHGMAGPPKAYIDVPTAAAIFPKELWRPPRQWAERHYRIEQWTEFPAGGHFAAMEEPGPLVDDIRAFFRDRH